MIDRTEQNRARCTVILGLACMGIFLSRPVLASDFIETSGDVMQVVIPAIGYGTTFYLHDTEGRTQFYKSFLTCFVVTHGLKYTIDKKRPNGSDMSFPSGHTSAAFQGAAFIQKRYGWKYGIPAYCGASWVGYSRVESDNHYIEDVLAGAAIGIASSYIFTKPYKGVTVTPLAHNGNYGISLSIRW